MKWPQSPVPGLAGAALRLSADRLGLVGWASWLRLAWPGCL